MCLIHLSASVQFISRENFKIVKLTLAQEKLANVNELDEKPRKIRALVRDNKYTCLEFFSRKTRISAHTIRELLALCMYMYIYIHIYTFIAELLSARFTHFAKPEL